MDTILGVLGIGIILFLLVKYMVTKARLEGLREAYQRGPGTINNNPPPLGMLGSGISTALWIIAVMVSCLVATVVTFNLLNQ